MRKLMMVLFLAGCVGDGLPGGGGGGGGGSDKDVVPGTTESALRPRDLGGPSDLSVCPASRCRAAANGCPNANGVPAMPGCEWGWCC